MEAPLDLRPGCARENSGRGKIHLILGTSSRNENVPVNNWIYEDLRWNLDQKWPSGVRVRYKDKKFLVKSINQSPNARRERLIRPKPELCRSSQRGREQPLIGGRDWQDQPEAVHSHAVLQYVVLARQQNTTRRDLPCTKLGIPAPLSQNSVKAGYSVDDRWAFLAIAFIALKTSSLLERQTSYSSRRAEYLALTVFRILSDSLLLGFSEYFGHLLHLFTLW